MKYRYATLYMLFTLLFLTTSVKAAHIIGGEMTYECLGPSLNNPDENIYLFTMKVYRDCQGGGAQFDSAPGASVQANLTVYLGDGPVPFISSYFPDAPVISAIDPDADNPCLIIPPNVCVEQAIYNFQISLPRDSQSYHIVYQRCCRNSTISNILFPEDAGSTYTVEITPKAQEECNSTPVFNDFPPVVICVDEPLLFDHSATDPDGDQLVYSFCSPLLGGTDTNVAPNPDSAPPFNEVQFVLPQYNALNPLGGDPQVSIDPNTGVISGVPNTQGQFVVGICVEEYRDGELLSRIQRDFQFNVAYCEPTVFADLNTPVQAGSNFNYVSCDDSTFTFINESGDEQFITEYYWEFDLNTATPLILSDRDVTVTFPGPGEYNGVMIVNPGTDCSDTAYVNVFIAPPIEPYFEFTYDTCVAGPVEFSNLTPLSIVPFEEYAWDFADTNTSIEVDPIHQYEEPGLYPVTLTVTDEFGCTGSTTEEVTWFPVPPLIIIEPSTFVGCPPSEIFFNNLSSPIDSTYEIVWDFGDGNFQNAISPTHIYEEPGLYDVSVEITSPIGCFTSDSFPEWIFIDSLPIADFNFLPTQSSNFEPTVEFTDASTRAVYWNWTFDEYGKTLGPNPTYTFPDTGMMEVQLLVTHIYGCQDSITKIVDVEPLITYFLPNAFTPNEDGKNEFFRGGGFFRGIRDFDIKILNRWGEIIFASSDPSEGWNGRKNNTGKRAPSGVYVYIIQFTGPRGQPHEYTGYATLIR